MTVLSWGHDALGLLIDLGTDTPARVLALADHPDPVPRGGGEPLVEVLLAGEGRARAGAHGIETRVGARLRYREHRASEQDGTHVLEVDLVDPLTGLLFTVRLTSPDGVAAVRSEVTVRNDGDSEAVLHAVTSVVLGCLRGSPEGTGSPDPMAGVDLLWARNQWLSEGRWHRRPLRHELPDIGLAVQGQDPKGGVTFSEVGTWSSGAHLPMGALVCDDGTTWLWQVEHDGSWLCEVGERRGGLYLAASGPTDLHHQWAMPLAPGETFTTVPVTVAVSSHGLDGPQGATAAMTGFRRATRRSHPDTAALPVIFNDYMNTLNGDPTTEKLLPLIRAAAAVGAEYFVIDAGWYDDTGDWWDSVGQWQPSTTRFPGGITEVLDAIRAEGMVPGLWLEPEVVGVRSPVADTLPDEAFFCRSGRRHNEHDRYHLDLSHPAARAHLDEVVDRLVGDLGIGYIKLDYNVNPGVGTDVGARSAGDGLLRHNRAHLSWLDGVLDRHPQLVLENCSSGGMRTDYALMSRLQLQSTSDQQDELRYPPIAVASPLALLPEQSASWAYPQPGMDDERIALSMLTGMLGRLYLSGHVDHMTPGQRDLVAQGVACYREIRHDLARATPAWPLGLPDWDDQWLALALVDPVSTYVGVWHRPVSGADDSTTVSLSLPHLRGDGASVETLYPRSLPEWDAQWDADGATLRLARPSGLAAARLFRVRQNSATSRRLT